MVVRKRNKHWQVDFMLRGVRYRETIVEAQTKQEAQQAETQMRRSVYEGRYGRQTRHITLETFIKDVFMPYARTNRKQWRQDEKHCERFIQFFKGRSLQEIPPMLIERYKKERLESKTRMNTVRRASSINLELSILSRIFNMGVENGYLNQNPLNKVRRLRTTGERERFLMPDEEVRLREVLKGARYFGLLALLDLALNTGMRVSEMIGLMWEEVSFERREIYLTATRTKEAKEKAIPLNRVALETLSTLYEDGEAGRVFGRGFERSYVERRWREACQEAKVYDLHIHDLRHTFATRLSAQGMTETAIASLLGHASLRMTSKYTHATAESRRAAVESLEKVCHPIVTDLGEKVRNAR